MRLSCGSGRGGYYLDAGIEFDSRCGSARYGDPAKRTADFPRLMELGKRGRRPTKTGANAVAFAMLGSRTLPAILEPSGVKSLIARFRPAGPANFGRQRDIGRTCSCRTWKRLMCARPCELGAALVAKADRKARWVIATHPVFSRLTACQKYPDHNFRKQNRRVNMVTAAASRLPQKRRPNCK
jgi:hypothetical protein